MARVYNFSAGPSMLPEKVLRQAQAELLEYGDDAEKLGEPPLYRENSSEGSKCRRS